MSFGKNRYVGFDHNEPVEFGTDFPSLRTAVEARAKETRRTHVIIEYPDVGGKILGKTVIEP
jgi:hypothetical protein